MYKTAIQPILTYGCSTIKLKPNDRDELEKVQASLIKATLDLTKYSRNTAPILRALNIKKIGRLLDERHLSLIRAALHNTSKSRRFHLHIISLSARILHRAPPPAPSGPKFSNSENCCGSENAMPPKIFWDMEGHRGHFRSKNIFWKKFIINHTIFLIFRYAFFRY